MATEVITPVAAASNPPASSSARRDLARGGRAVSRFRVIGETSPRDSVVAADGGSPSSAARTCAPFANRSPGDFARHLLHNRLELRVDQQGALAQRGDGVARDRDEHGSPVRRAEGPRAGEHLVDQHAEGEDVGACVERLAHRLLGRHVLGRAQQAPRLGGHERLGVREGRVRGARRALGFASRLR